MTQVIVHAPRDADLAALDQPLEPSSDVHAVAEDVVVLDHDVADIDADPEAHPASSRLAFVGPLKRRLDLDRVRRARWRIRRARRRPRYSRSGLDVGQ